LHQWGTERVGEFVDRRLGRGGVRLPALNGQGELRMGDTHGNGGQLQKREALRKKKKHHNLKGGMKKREDVGRVVKVTSPPSKEVEKKRVRITLPGGIERQGRRT